MAFVVPSSDAVYTLREHIIRGEVPGVTAQHEIFADAMGHPRPPIVNLVSYVWFAAMYRQSPVGLKALVDANDPTSAARELLLQQIAWNAVVAEPMSGVTGMAESFTAAAQPAQETTMTAAERAEVIELLQKSEQELEKAIAGLTDAQWSFKPGPDRWSVGEVVEHIVLADALLFETAITSLDSAANAKWEGTLGKTNHDQKSHSRSLAKGRRAGRDQAAAGDDASGGDRALQGAAVESAGLRPRYEQAAQGPHGAKSVLRRPQRAPVAALYPVAPHPP